MAKQRVAQARVWTVWCATAALVACGAEPTTAAAGGTDAVAPDAPVADTAPADAPPADTAPTDAVTADVVPDVAQDVPPADTDPADAPEPDAGQGDVADATDPCLWIKCGNLGPCVANVCVAGTCVKSPAPGACDDGNVCTTGDHCDGGNCLPGGTALSCDDGLACTTDTCDPALGCQTAPSSGGPCDDANACTSNDTCAAGLCAGDTITCDDANPCTTDLCVPADGSCVHSPQTSGACSDGDPCTIDDVCSQGSCAGVPTTCVGTPAYLKAPTPGKGATFGSAVAVTANTLVVGAPQEVACSGALGSGCYEGTVHVYTVAGTTWTFDASIKAPYADAGDKFGSAVAIDGGTIVIGAPGEGSCDGTAKNNGCPGAGAAYVFTRVGQVWTQAAFLKAESPVAGGAFGSSVAIRGGIVVVGAPGSSNARLWFIDGSWTTAATLSSPSGKSDGFGTSVSTTGGTGIAIGAPLDDHVYTYVGSVASWVMAQALTPTLPAGGSTGPLNFGISIAQDAATLVVGVPGYSGCGTGVSGTCTSAGAVATFDHSTGTWVPQPWIQAPSVAAFAQFGRSVAFFKYSLAVGAPFDSQCPGSASACDNRGAAYLWTYLFGGWQLESTVYADNSSPFAWFGSSVGVYDNGLMAVGAPGEASCDGAAPNDTGCAQAGAAYVVPWL